MYGGYVICGVALALGIWNLTIAILGCFPRYRRTAVGTLTKAQTWKNVRTRSGRTIPFLTKYRYVYTVHNRTYAYNCEVRHNKRRLFQKPRWCMWSGFPGMPIPIGLQGNGNGYGAFSFCSLDFCSCCYASGDGNERKRSSCIQSDAAAFS